MLNEAAYSKFSNKKYSSKRGVNSIKKYWFAFMFGEPDKSVGKLSPDLQQVYG